MLTRRDFAIAAGATLFTGGARAQTYPDHPIRILIGYPAGGGVDLVARLLGEPMKAALGQPIIVENRPGASAMLAAQAVATAPPDGHTLLMAAAGEIATNQHLYKERMTYDPLRQLAPVALVGIVPCVVVVAATTPVHTPAELIAYARANRGKLSFSSSGIGNPQQLAGELMNTMAGTDVLHVPYRGAAPATNDLLAGTVDTVLLDISVLLPHVRTGAIKILAVTSDTRPPLLPDVPTMRELGFPKVNSDNWYALISPAASPAEARKKIFDAASTALKTQAVIDAYAAAGGVVGGGTSAELAAFLREEGTKWAEVVKFANVKLE